MPNCRELTELATDYLEGRLPFRGRLGVSAHLLICGNCRRYMRQLRLTIRAARQLPPEPMPEELADALYRAFREARPPAPPPTPRLEPRRSWLESLDAELSGAPGWLIAGGSLLVALLYSLAPAGPPIVSPGGDGHCFATILGFGAALVAALRIAARSHAPLSSGAFVTAAAVGASVGFALVARSCPAVHLVAHALPGHVGGIAAAVLFAALAARLQPGRP